MKVISLFRQVLRPRFLLSTAALGAAIFLALSPKTAQTGPTQTSEIDARPVVVRVAEVSQARVARDVGLSGTTRSERRAAVSFQVGGRLALRLVDLGDSFRRGDLLARLDSRSFDLAVAGAEAKLTEVTVRLTQAQRQQRRTMGLFEKKAATREEMEAIDAEVEALEAARAAAASLLDEARRLASDTEVIAPFDGVVAEVLLEPGEYAVAGRPVLRLSGDGAVEVEVEVPESLLPTLFGVRQVRVVFPALDREVLGTVRSLGRTSGGSGRLFPLVVALPERPWLIPGLSAEVISSGASLSGVAVPLAAIRAIDSERPSVFCVRDGRVYEIAVKVSGFAGERVVVTGEIERGDKVVVSGHAGLVEASVVEVHP